MKSLFFFVVISFLGLSWWFVDYSNVSLLDVFIISASFFVLSFLVFVYYKKILLKKDIPGFHFLATNMAKDVFWTLVLGYFYKNDKFLILYMVFVFSIGSVVLYSLVIRSLKD